ncbi:MAG: glycosyltransferase [Kiritimatiellae bacterium]|nr:glycosyltransferase [Kiritimatiellia bacterium]
MRICLLGPTHPFRGGIAHYTTFLCRALRREHTVKFISFRRQYPRFLFPGRSDRDPSGTPATVGEVDYLLDPLHPLTWGATARAMCAFEPELIVVPWWVAFWAPPFLAVCRAIRRHCRAEIVFICHNVIEHESSGWKRAATRAVLRQGDRFIVHSGEDRDNLLALLPGAAVTVGFLPTYADLADARVDAGEARRRLGIDAPVLLFFGFVRRYKGLDILLEALPLIRRQVPATLLVCGEFWKDKEQYLALIRRLGIENAVRIEDRYVSNEELPLYLGAADLVILPYRSGTGSAVAQLAFGFGKPVVATRVGCLPEVVRDGVDGRLVPPENPQALAQAVTESLEPAQLAALTEGARRAKERFSWENMVRLLTAGKTAGLRFVLTGSRDGRSAAPGNRVR